MNSTPDDIMEFIIVNGVDVYNWVTVDVIAKSLGFIEISNSFPLKPFEIKSKYFAQLLNYRDLSGTESFRDKIHYLFRFYDGHRSDSYYVSEAIALKLSNGCYHIEMNIGKNPKEYEIVVDK